MTTSSELLQHTSWLCRFRLMRITCPSVPSMHLCQSSGLWRRSCCACETGEIAVTSRSLRRRACVLLSGVLQNYIAGQSILSTQSHRLNLKSEIACCRVAQTKDRGWQGSATAGGSVFVLISCHQPQVVCKRRLYSSTWVADWMTWRI